MKNYEREELLNERAKRFLEEAKDDLKKKFFDLAAFHLEQALQLKLKYVLAKKIGYFSKTYMLSTLLREVEKVVPKLRKIMEEEKESIEELEIAYTASRYLPIKYSREKVEKMLKSVEKIFNFVERYES